MDGRFAGWGAGTLGMLIFSGSLPATRVAVADFPPLFLTSARAAIAALLGALCLAALRPARPGRRDMLPLGMVAGGVVIGFPLLTALALQSTTAAHAAAFVGILPLSTALFAVLRGGERPRPAFWLFAGAGAACVAGFALSQGGAGALQGDVLMLAAVLVCGLGYAEGAALSRRLGGWQVISWALLLAAPAMIALALVTRPADFAQVALPAWLGLGYVAAFSMLIGFVFWYRGLALGGIAGVGQLQLLQPFASFALAALVLGEAVSWPMLACAFGAALSVAGARRFA